MPDLICRLTSHLIAATIGAAPVAASAQVSSPPPVRWYGASQDPGAFEFTRDTVVVHGGRTSIRVRSTEEPTAFANVMAVLPAQPYVGHRIRLSVFVRTASLGGAGGMLWARADDAGHRSVAFINTQATPVRGTTDWTQVAISLDIPPSANQLRGPRCRNLLLVPLHLGFELLEEVLDEDQLI